MKTSVKTMVAAGLLIAGGNMMTSCNSCSEKKETNETTVTETSVYDNDTTDMASGDTIGGYNTETSTSTTVSRGNSSSSTGSTSGSGRNTSGTNGGSSSASGGSGKATTAPAIDPANDPIENSNYYRNKKTGTVDGGGNGGNGGTGTGTTGNNSRVSDPRDQRD